MTYDECCTVFGFGPNTDVTKEEVGVRFRKLAKLAHPDTTTGSAEKFKELATARTQLENYVDSGYRRVKKPKAKARARARKKSTARRTTFSHKALNLVHEVIVTHNGYKSVTRYYEAGAKWQTTTGPDGYYSEVVGMQSLDERQMVLDVILRKEKEELAANQTRYQNVKDRAAADAERKFDKEFAKAQKKTATATEAPLPEHIIFFDASQYTTVEVAVAFVTIGLAILAALALAV